MNRLAGRRVALTGQLPGVSRHAFAERVRAVGGVYMPAVDALLDVLVVGDEPLLARVDRARRVGVEVVDAAVFDRWWEAEASFGEDHPQTLVPAVERWNGGIRVLDAALAASAGDRLEVHADYTLDEPTLRLLRFLVRAAGIRKPALIEGTAGVGKTAAVTALARWTGVRCLRLQQPTNADLEAALEDASTRGSWLVIDGLPGSDPRGPGPLQRFLGETERYSGEGVHEDFRLFATLNPTDYEDRWSAAWRARWPMRWAVPALDEREWVEMFLRMAVGVQPDVSIEGVLYQGERGPASRPALAAVVGMEAFLRACAGLQAALARALGVAGSRRVALQFADLLCDLRLIDPVSRRSADLLEAPRAVAIAAVEHAYLDIWSEPAQRDAARQMARSLGLARDTFAYPLGGAC